MQTSVYIVVSLWPHQHQQDVLLLHIMKLSVQAEQDQVIYLLNEIKETLIGLYVLNGLGGIKEVSDILKALLLCSDRPVWISTIELEPDWSMAAGSIGRNVASLWFDQLAVMEHGTFVESDSKTQTTQWYLSNASELGPWQKQKPSLKGFSKSHQCQNHRTGPCC